MGFTNKSRTFKTLADGGTRRFRWAVCQLEALARCFKKSALRQALNSLPRNLDETYQRILNGIDEDNLKDALKLFRWLVFSDRPLRVKELAEAVAISFREQPSFSPEDRLRHPTDLLRICPSLVSLHQAEDGDDTSEDVLNYEVRLAHYSVREYLVSSWASLAETPSQMFIAESCLVYLLHLGQAAINSGAEFHRSMEPVALDEEYPLCAYAARYWPGHAVHTHGTLRSLIESLFTSPNTFNRWIDLYNPDVYGRQGIPKYRCSDQSDLEIHGKPLYCASLLGFHDIVKTLLEQGHKITEKVGKYGSALGAAAAEGHAHVVNLLLLYGASVSAPAGFYKNALHAAIAKGSLDCTRALISAGSYVNQDLRDHGSICMETPLLLAAEEGHLEIVKLLIAEQADISVEGYYGNAIQAALSGAHDDVVQFLLAMDTA